MELSQKDSSNLMWFSMGVAVLGNIGATRAIELAASEVDEKKKLQALSSAADMRFVSHVGAAYVVVQCLKSSPKLTAGAALGVLALSALPWRRSGGHSSVGGAFVGAEVQQTCFACAPGQRPIAYCAPGGVMPLPPPIPTSQQSFGPGF